MLKKSLLLISFITLHALCFAQKKDTVIVNLAKTSNIIFTVEDPDDLQILKHYDFQKLFEDVLIKIEEKKRGLSDTSGTAKELATPTEESTEVKWDDSENDVAVNNEDNDKDEPRENDDNTVVWEDDDNDDNDSDYDWQGHRKWNRTWQAFNFDFGLNNYLEDKKFPSDNKPYEVRPWGSWYVGLASVQRTRLAKKFFLEWALGMNWYTFKYQEDNILMVKDDNGVSFVEDTRPVNFMKSKLSASYVQASLVPVLDFGDHGRKPRFWDGYDDHSFRIGFGPYIAYRISSHSKLVYDEGDGKEKEKDNDSFYLTDFRYGLRLQIGYRSTDLFFNYDLNKLYEDGKAPKLNAFSFGVIF